MLRALQSPYLLLINLPNVIASVIGSYITVYSTPRRILTDQGRNFESEQFLSYAIYFACLKLKLPLIIQSHTGSVNVSIKFLNIHLLRFYRKISIHLETCTFALQSSFTISQFTQLPASRPSFSLLAQSAPTARYRFRLSCVCSS